MFIRLWSIGIACSVLTGSAWAQAEPRQTQPGNGPGNAVPSPRTQDQFSRIPWFTNPVAREQLRLQDNEFNQLNQSYREAWNRWDQGQRGLGNNLTPLQRQQREGELSSQFRNDLSKRLDTVFTDRDIRQRYNQLDWQYQGYGAFSDPVVLDRLSLTDAQRQQFTQFERDWHNQLKNWRRDYADDRERISRQFTEARRAAQERIESTLTAEQKQKWNELRGKPFDFSADLYFPDTTTNTTLKPPLK